MRRSSFLVNLQACRLIAGNSTNIWTPPQIFFNIILPPPPISPPMYWFKPSRFPATVGNPGISAGWLWRWEILLGGEFLCGGEISPHCRDGKFCWEGNFYVVVGIWGWVILTIQIFFKVKKQHIVKIPPVGGYSEILQGGESFLLGGRNVRSGFRWCREFYQTCFCFLKKLYLN